MTPEETDAALDAAVSDELVPSGDQVERITSALTAWVLKRGRSGDPRLASLIELLPQFSRTLKFVVRPGTGLGVIVPNGNRVALFLERGSTWLRGGDWQNVALACVSMETSKP